MPYTPICQYTNMPICQYAQSMLQIVQDEDENAQFVQI